MHLLRITSLFISVLFLSCNSINQQEKVETSKLPNVIFIYTDDLGYGDLGCFGADSIATPYLDKMAANGMKFTNFYTTSPICSPSRTSLLTGRYQVRSGVTRVFFPNSLQGLDPSEYTMAEMFKSKGYHTALIGKWHLGHREEFLPMNQGFDYWFGLPYSNDMEWKPRKDPPLPLIRNGKTIAQPVNQKELTQRYTKEAQYYISEHQDEPFFMYFAHTFPHKPLHVSAEFEGVSNKGKYGDVVQELDKSVGDIFETLRKFNLEENTLVIFSSDNGPVIKVGGSSGGLRGQKTTTWDGGIKVPTIASWKGKIKAGEVNHSPLIMTDWMPTFAHIINAELPDIPFDGDDISRTLFENEQMPDRDFYFYFNEDLRAIRSGKWKFKNAVIDNPYRQKALKPHEDALFDLEKDPNETINLAERYPAKVKELKQLMLDFETSLGPVPEPKLKAIPFDDPRNKNKKK